MSFSSWFNQKRAIEETDKALYELQHNQHALKVEVEQLRNELLAQASTLSILSDKVLKRLRTHYLRNEQENELPEDPVERKQRLREKLIKGMSLTK